MSLTDNFSQAVKEMLNRNAKEKTSTEAPKSELDEYIKRSYSSQIVDETPVQQAQPVPPVQPMQQPVQQVVTPQPMQQPVPPVQPVMQATPVQQMQQPVPPVQPQYTQPVQQMGGQPTQMPQQAPAIPYSDTEEQTVISRNTIIEGNIRSFANVTVEGSIKGDVSSTKNTKISGKLVGDLSCNNAIMEGSQIQGDVTSKGQVCFDKDSLILGNVSASFLDMNGKVKGDLDINGKAEFKSDAYIIGNINVSTLTVSEGATISGHVNTTFLQDTPSAVFPEMIAMSELN